MLNLLLYLLLVWCAKIESANILAVYPVPSISHQVVFRRVTLELVKQGHNVTVITPDPAFPKKDGPENLREIDVHDVSYETMREMMASIDKNELLKITSDAKFFSNFTRTVFEVQMKVAEVLEVIQDNNTQYDLILMEEIMRPYIAVSHVIKAPVILFSSFGGSLGTFEQIGVQTHPILYPNQMCTRVYNLNFWEKLEKFYNYYNILYQDLQMLKEEHKVLQKFFGPDIPVINELYKNVHMIFLNAHSIWNDNQPVSPNVIYLGGLHQLETKELPQDLKTYLDSSKHGVIYVSFGTNALSTILQTEKIEIIAKVLGQTQYDVLWKWDQDTLPGQTKNIRLSKWLPQADLLRHPKIKLFITQAGLQSTDEAITAGVPLLAFPVLGDQWYNAEKYEHHGIGKKYFFHEINEDTVKKAVEEIIDDKRYRENILKLQQVLNDQPMKPLERAMFWIHHIIRHKGGKHLVPATANLTWEQYYEVDFVMIILALASVFVVTVSFVVHKLYTLVMNNVKKSKKIKAT